MTPVQERSGILIIGLFLISSIPAKMEYMVSAGVALLPSSQWPDWLSNEAMVPSTPAIQGTSPKTLNILRDWNHRMKGRRSVYAFNCVCAHLIALITYDNKNCKHYRCTDIYSRAYCRGVQTFFKGGHIRKYWNSQGPIIIYFRSDHDSPTLYIQ